MHLLVVASLRPVGFTAIHGIQKTPSMAVYGRLKHRKGRSVWNAVLMDILYLMGKGMSKYFIRLGFNERDMTGVCE